MNSQNNQQRFISINDFSDKFITCCDCGDEFLWSKGEQAFFKSISLLNPRRCPACRQLRKSRLIVVDTQKDGELQ